jgi:hypothetical protein
VAAQTCPGTRPRSRLAELIGRTVHAQALLVIPFGDVRQTNALQALVE